MLLAVGVDVEPALCLDDGCFPLEFDAFVFVSGGGGFLIVFVVGEADAAFDFLALLFGGGFDVFWVFFFLWGGAFGTLDGGDGGVAWVQCRCGDDVMGFKEAFVAFGAVVRIR